MPGSCRLLHETLAHGFRHRLGAIAHLELPEDGAEVRFDGLLADFCVQNGISFIFRVLRSSADFEYERSIALTNRCRAPSVETLFLAAAAGSSFISSSIVREVALNRGDVSSLVPPAVASRLQSKFS